MLEGLLCLYWILPDIQCSLVFIRSLVQVVKFFLILAPISHRYERSWGHFFESFEAFLAFSWPVITVTDASTGRAHIVTRLNSIGAFIKMIKTRYMLVPESLFKHLMTLSGQVRRDSPAGSQHLTSYSI